MELSDLEPGDFFRLLRVKFKQTEQAAFAKDDEFSVGHDAGAAPVNFGCGCAVRLPMFVAVPHEFASFEFDAAKMGVGLVAAAEGIEKTVVIDRRVPVKFEDCAAPYLLNAFAVRSDFQKH